jgi:3-methyl-2-oxobutanoate hydroxymethyltransferase
MERTKIIASQLQAKKKYGEKIVALTAYDYLSAKLLDESGVDILLVGDSLGMVVLGYDNTLRVTVEEMLHHTRAVARARPKAMVVTDMPFLSYQPSVRDAVYNAGRLLREGGAEAVKIEGGEEVVDKIRAILDAGIPVVGHLGMRPQQTLRVGGYRVQGRDPKDADRMLRDARLLEEVGVLAIVLECVPTDVARTISQALRIPTIGIGAGKDCDGQILVLHDLMGFTNGSQPKFVKRYADMATEMKNAVTRYKQEVLAGSYPDKDHSYER